MMMIVEDKPTHFVLAISPLCYVRLVYMKKKKRKPCGDCTRRGKYLCMTAFLSFVYMAFLYIKIARNNNTAAMSYMCLTLPYLYALCVVHVAVGFTIIHSFFRW